MLFSTADVIVAEFGAAMANVVFCRPGTKIVEIIAEGQHDPWSAHLCAMLELEHVVLFQKQSEQDLLDHPRHAKDSEFQFSVDLESLVRDGQSVTRSIGAAIASSAYSRASRADTGAGDGGSSAKR